MTDRYAIGDWTSIWGSEPYLIHRLVLDLQSRCVIAGQDRYRRRRTPMSFADLAYVQEMLDETFNDIWSSPAEDQFELSRLLKYAFLNARPLTRKRQRDAQCQLI